MSFLKPLFPFAVLAALIGCASAPPPKGADFFEPPLGAALSGLPGNFIPVGDCSIGADFADCEFRTSAGVLLTVFGKTLTRKRIIVSDAPGPLPFGLTPNMDLKATIRRIHAETGLLLEPTNIEGTYDAIATNSLGVPFSLYVAVDRKGSLIEIGVTAGEGE